MSNFINDYFTTMVDIECNINQDDMETNNKKLIELLENEIYKINCLDAISDEDHTKDFVVISLHQAKSILAKLIQLEQIYQQ